MIDAIDIPETEVYIFLKWYRFIPPYQVPAFDSQYFISLTDLVFL